VKEVVRRAKDLVKVAAGKKLLLKPDVVCPKERFGSDYGGWDVVIEGIDPQSVVYSFGVGEDASFDTALIERFDLTIHAFDPSPESIAWVKKQGFPDRFVMHEYGIAAFDGEVAFNPAENPDWVSYTILARPSTKSRAISVPVKTLGTIMKELGHDRLDVLKLDVEGAEYDVINELSKSGIRPRQILVEFHHRFPGVGIKESREATSRLRSAGYQLFSVSASNEECGFIRISR
jgi:FkbM family methyltransferase